MKQLGKAFAFIALLAGVLCLDGCRKEPLSGDDPTPENKNGIVSFVNPAQDREISSGGETVSCVVFAEDTYEAELVFHEGGEDWAEITKGAAGEEGRNTIRLVFSPNTLEEGRSVELFIQVKGFERHSLAVFSQKKDEASATMRKNLALNTYMNKRLAEEYLWGEYNDLQVDLSVDFTDFLNIHLTRLGDVNIEDGGYRRQNSSDPGARFIYSNIQEIEPLTRAMETSGLGFGPIFSSQIDQQGTIGLSVGYVHQGSPAYLAGMKRGDTIYKVNGVTLNGSNYQNYMTALYYSPSGKYEFEFVRNADMTTSYKVEVTTAVYRYDPVLYSAVMKEGSHIIGYLALENFDLDAQDYIVDIVQQLKDNSITDLILDLRFNPGGAVAQSRYLASAIVGSSHLDEVFVNVEFRDGKKQEWKFRGGPNDEDGLGIAPDLGLNRLYVIGSENTASASELIINALRGIDFPVRLYGSRTEGKNVGMTTTQMTFEGSRYLFSPITFRVSNAKGFGKYPDGFEPDVMLNNQNNSYADDADNLFPYSFGDWPDMNFNVALRMAYEDIIGNRKPSSSAQTKSADTFTPIPLGSTEPVQPKAGRYGNVIYK